MSATITLEIQLAPNVEKLLNNLIAALTPKTVTNNQQILPQPPTEQAARMRMQQTPAPRPQQAVPTYTPQQYRPQPGPAPAAPYAMGNAPVVPTAPIRNPQSAPANPTPPPAKAVSPAGPSTAQPAAAPSNPAPVAAAPAYERDQLARATATLADAGKVQQIQQLFQQFGIQQLTQLPKERYGEYATALRGLGVRI